MLRIRRDISAIEVPHLSNEGPQSPPCFPPRSTGVWKRSPHIWLRKTGAILTIYVTRNDAENPDVFFKGLCTDSLPHRHSPWALREGK